MEVLLPSLVITEIRVSRKSGGLAIHLNSFGPGLNIIRGESSTGRTTLLKLFEFGLGADLHQRDFIPEIKNCEKLVLEIELNNVPYTIDRNFRGSQEMIVRQGRIDDLFRPHTAMIRGEISEFLLRRLTIPIVNVLDTFSGREKSITFNDIYDSLYLDQEKGFSEIQAKLSRKQRTNVFKLLTGISSPDSYELLIKEDELKNKRHNQEQEIEYLDRFLSNIEIIELSELSARVRVISEETLQFETLLEGINNQIRSRSDFANPLREELLTAEESLANKKQELSFANQTLRAYSNLENQLAEDLDKASRVRASVNQLSTFEFEQCPRCLQEVTEEMKDKELNGDCSLCGRVLLTVSDDIEDLNLYEEQIQDQLDELTGLQERYRETIQEISENLSELEEDVANKRETLDEMMEELVSPAIDNIVILNQKLTKLNIERNHLESQIKWHFQIQKLQDSLENLQNELLEVQERISEINEKESIAENKLTSFKRFFQSFYADFFIDSDTEIMSKTFLPKLDGYNYKSRSATEKNIALLGYYYALLRFSLETESYIPRFMVIDTLRQDELARETYSNVLRHFKNLEEIYDKEFQLFIVVNESFNFLPTAKVNLTDSNRLLNLS